MYIVQGLANKAEMCQGLGAANVMYGISASAVPLTLQASYIHTRIPFLHPRISSYLISQRFMTVTRLWCLQ